MGGTGITFTGCIGVGTVTVTPPPSIITRWGIYNSSNPATVTMTAPAGIQVGDTMVAVVEAGAYAALATYSFTPAAGWTPHYVDPNGHEIMTNLYSKVADLADQNQTSSYTWTFSAPGALVGMIVGHLGWAPQYGTTISSASVDHTTAPSITAPAGAWNLAWIAQRSRSHLAQPTPNPVVTSTATLLAELVPGGVSAHRAGVGRVYASQGVTPITGSYLTTFDQNRQGLVVAAVS